MNNININTLISRAALSHSTSNPELNEVPIRVARSCRYMMRRAMRDKKEPFNYFEGGAKFEGFSSDELLNELQKLQN